MKPWDETWDPKADWTIDGRRIWTVYDRAREDAGGTYEVATVEHDDEPAARLIAAAPAMARALCLLERGTVITDDGCPSFPEHYGTEGCCGCGEETLTDDGVVHAPNCPVDAALTEAGLDAAARAAVRASGGRTST